MSVWQRFDSGGFPSLITTNVENRQPIFDSPDATRLLIRVISEVRHEARLKLLAFVVMPDHLHLVVAGRQPHGRVMRLIKGRFSHRYNRANGRCGKLWQERYHERALRSETELVSAIRYVHENPVKAGLASQAESFCWSSANPTYETDLQAYLEQGTA